MAVHRVLRKALNDAVLWGLLARSPLVGVTPPRRDAPEMRAWTPEEARRFLAAVADDRLYALWALARHAAPVTSTPRYSRANARKPNASVATPASEGATARDVTQA